MNRPFWLTILWASAIAGMACAQTSSIDPGRTLAPGESLGIASVPNMRDAGGYMTGDGAIMRRGLVYRASGLNQVSPEDISRVAQLGLKTVFDPRTADEVKKHPDELPDGLRRVWLNVLADEETSGPARLEQLLRNPKEANATFGGGKVEAMFEQAYRSFVSLPSARRAYHELFVALGRRDQLPALYHCTTGKDRTGWAAAALLTLFGVPKEKVIEDFMRSNDYILPAYEHDIDAFVASGGDRSIVIAIFGVKKCCCP